MQVSPVIPNISKHKILRHQVHPDRSTEHSYGNILELSHNKSLDLLEKIVFSTLNCFAPLPKSSCLYLWVLYSVSLALPSLSCCLDFCSSIESLEIGQSESFNLVLCHYCGGYSTYFIFPE